MFKADLLQLYTRYVIAECWGEMGSSFLFMLETEDDRKTIRFVVFDFSSSGRKASLTAAAPNRLVSKIFSHAERAFTSTSAMAMPALLIRTAMWPNLASTSAAAWEIEVSEVTSLTRASTESPCFCSFFFFSF